MKKLLSVLGSFGLVATAGAAVVACGPDETTFEKPATPDAENTIELYIGEERVADGHATIWIEKDFWNAGDDNQPQSVNMDSVQVAHHLFTGIFHHPEIKDTNGNGLDDNYFESQDIGSKLKADNLVAAINDKLENNGGTKNDEESAEEIKITLTAEDLQDVKVVLTEDVVVCQGSNDTDVVLKQTQEDGVSFAAKEADGIALEVIFLNN